MEITETFFSKIKYLVIGFILGAGLQFLGELDKVIFGGIGVSVLSFSDIMGTLGFWAGLILLLIFRDKTPKTVLRDIFFLFAAMDFGYYLVQFIFDYVQITHLTSRDGLVSEALTAALVDFAMYTFIGTAAAFWGDFTVTMRNKQRKFLYILHLAPLFGVLVYELGEWAVNIALYFKEQHDMSLGIMPPDGTRRCFI